MEEKSGSRQNNNKPKNFGTRRKPKGRFGESTANRGHYKKNLVFDRVTDDTTVKKLQVCSFNCDRIYMFVVINYDIYTH